MQPLPRASTTMVFERAADQFFSAARAIDKPATSGPLLQAGASSLFQGIPSLRMTLPRDTATPMATALTAAAEGAMSLARQMRSTPTADFSSTRQAVEAWSQLALDASAAV